MYITHLSSVFIACMVAAVTHANHVINKPQWLLSSGFLSASTTKLLILAPKNTECKNFFDLCNLNSYSVFLQCCNIKLQNIKCIKMLMVNRLMFIWAHSLWCNVQKQTIRVHYFLSLGFFLCKYFFMQKRAEKVKWPVPVGRNAGEHTQSKHLLSMGLFPL